MKQFLIKIMAAKYCDQQQQLFEQILGHKTSLTSAQQLAFGKWNAKVFRADEVEVAKRPHTNQDIDGRLQHK